MKEIDDKPVETSVDRTKARWVAGVYREFGRPKTTVPALYYFALGRKVADYPICGGFVGEIRAMRRYHESDCPKLEKWVERARLFGHLREDAILKGLVGEFVASEAEAETETAGSDKPRIALWLTRPVLAPLVLPVCQKKRRRPRIGRGKADGGGDRAAEPAVTNLEGWTPPSAPLAPGSPSATRPSIPSWFYNAAGVRSVAGRAPRRLPPRRDRG